MSVTVDMLDIDVFRVRTGNMRDVTVTCRTCLRGVDTDGLIELGSESLPYGFAIFTPMSHDPHCPARNHVYLEGIGPMIEPRAMVFEKEGENGQTNSKTE